MADIYIHVAIVEAGLAVTSGQEGSHMWSLGQAEIECNV